MRASPGISRGPFTATRRTRCSPSRPPPARADRLSAWIATKPKLTNANARRWLYQHSWIVTGAKFGWWHGEQALEKLIAVDQRVEQIWGIGHRSERVARAALARVRRESK